MKSQLIKNKIIADDEWVTVELPKIEQKIKMQAGKVVAFKLSGEDYPTDDQVINIVREFFEGNLFIEI